MTPRRDAIAHAGAAQPGQTQQDGAAMGVEARRWARSATAAVIAIGALVLAGIAPAQAATATASISGHVTDKATGKPLAGVNVTAVTDPGFYGHPGSAVTDAAGNYVITGLDQGTRLVEFSAGAPYADEYWPHVPVDRLAQPIVSNAGDTRTGIDAALEQPASLSGTLTRADTGAPAAGVVVILEQRDVDQRDQWTKYAYTDTDGHYSIGGILPGAYRVHLATGFTDALVIANQYWPTTFHSDDATLVTLAANEDRTGLDTDVMPQSIVSGVVTRADTGVPVAGARIEPIDSEGYDVGYAYTDADGHYRVGLLPPGAFTMRVHPPQATGTANDLAVTSGGVSVPLAGTAMDDVAVDMGGHIGGTVEYLPGWFGDTTITAYRWSGTRWADETTDLVTADQFAAKPYGFRPWSSDAGAVRPGTYIVEFAAPGMCTKYWNGAFAQSTATSFTVAAHQAVSGISVFMTPTCTNPAVVPGSVIITGAVATGSRLTASTSNWKPISLAITGQSSAAFGYQWYAVSGTISTPIKGATGRTFTPTSALVGRPLKVTVRGSLPGTPSVSRTSALSAKVALTATPAISGIRARGYALTAHHGTWTSGTSFSYAWYADGAYIPSTSGPTHSTFTPTSAQIGKSISVKVSGTRAGYGSAARVSGGTARIALTAAPTITGTKHVGDTLYAHPGAWTRGTTFTYRWYANGVAISGATHSSVTLTSGQRGKTITVHVTGSLLHYQTIIRFSAATARVA